MYFHFVVSVRSCLLQIAHFLFSNCACTRSTLHVTQVPVIPNNPSVVYSDDISAQVHFHGIDSALNCQWACDSVVRSASAVDVQVLCPHIIMPFHLFQNCHCFLNSKMLVVFASDIAVVLLKLLKTCHW